jgi:pimeloyl-ACP methyl ester carboxylesterase
MSGSVHDVQQVAAATQMTAGAASAQGAAPPAGSAPAPEVPVPTVVLVHGAFADGSAWARVIPLLERAGTPVVAVQNPLTSFETDVANTRRVFDAQPGPVVAVGHSYGGAVITQAAAGSDTVRALVYVAAFAPDAGETVGGLWAEHPAPMAEALVTDAGGFVSLDRAKLRDVFAADLPEAETRVMAATQKPIHGSAFQATLDAAAWRDRPSWYLVAAQDRSISPELQRLYARRAHATTVELPASHVPFLSRPDDVARLIVSAAAGAVAGDAETPVRRTARP